MSTELDLMNLRLYKKLMKHAGEHGVVRSSVLKICQIAIGTSNRGIANWAVMGRSHMINIGLTADESAFVLAVVACEVNQ